jgi:bisphosphoglycerate-independent phosphoglycerate mutase (AlkP superfamily)
VKGEVEGMHLLDIAPTLLDLAGFETPESMQGCSLLAHSRSEVGCGLIR